MKRLWSTVLWNLIKNCCRITSNVCCRVFYSAVLICFRAIFVILCNTRDIYPEGKWKEYKTELKLSVNKNRLNIRHKLSSHWCNDWRIARPRQFVPYEHNDKSDFGVFVDIDKCLSWNYSWIKSSNVLNIYIPNGAYIILLFK